jgi:hypothetical protein
LLYLGRVIAQDLIFKCINSNPDKPEKLQVS